MPDVRCSPLRPAGLLVALAVVALPACVTTLGGGGPVWVGVDGDNDCRVEAAGEGFALPVDEARLAARLRRLARRTTSALMSPPPALTSPGCWDMAVEMVRAAGFTRIGYVDIDPPEGRVG